MCRHKSSKDLEGNSQFGKRSGTHHVILGLDFWYGMTSLGLFVSAVASDLFLLDVSCLF